MKTCLYCYKPLEDGFVDYHPICSKKIFGTYPAPVFIFNKEKIEELARNQVAKRNSITGFQPKLSLDFEELTNKTRLTVLGLHGKFIFKPPYNRYECMPENEDLTMHLSEVAGLKTAKHTLIKLDDGSLGYITQRFDRTIDGKKIALEDLCQLSSKPTEYKYKGSLEQMGKIVLKFVTNTGLEAQRLFELVIFSFLTGAHSTLRCN